MWTCKVCSKSVEDAEVFCYHCGSDRSITPESAARARGKAQDANRRPDGSLQCLRCRGSLRYAGVKKFHEGSRGWGFWLGNLGELFTHREEFDLYVCPRCGKIEMFVDGIGEEFRSEAL